MIKELIFNIGKDERLFVKLILDRSGLNPLNIEANMLIFMFNALTPDYKYSTFETGSDYVFFTWTVSNKLIPFFEERFAGKTYVKFMFAERN